MKPALASLLQGQSRLWRGRERPLGLLGLATGHPTLDAVLPGGGWPRGAVSELLPRHSGIGELTLLVPALARLSQAGDAVALIAPPHRPYAPALAARGVALERLVVVSAAAADAWWAAEQLLREGGCAAVALWPRTATPRGLRRLQLAAEEAAGWAFVTRPAAWSAAASPAALRLALSVEDAGLCIELLKCRGAHPRRLRLPCAQ